MWQEISRHISQVIGYQFRGEKGRVIGGGSINQAFLLADGEQRFFVKLNTAGTVEMFAAEAIALQQMLATRTIRVPEPICWGTTGSHAYIVLEWLDLGGAQNWERLGEALAALHRVTCAQGFGWQQSNTIGSTPQPNPWTTDWVEFFRHHRLAYQLQLAKRRGFSCPVPVERFLSVIPGYFVDYRPQPSLVHGDLWGGNASCTQVGEPVIFDPALYYGDREVDIAMTELFGGFSPDFYRAYQRAYPLDPGYERRKPLYNLYHILNHYNLFGDSYGYQASRLIQQLVKF